MLSSVTDGVDPTSIIRCRSSAESTSYRRSTIHAARSSATARSRIASAQKWLEHEPSLPSAIPNTFSINVIDLIRATRSEVVRSLYIGMGNDKYMDCALSDANSGNSRRTVRSVTDGVDPTSIIRCTSSAESTWSVQVHGEAGVELHQPSLRRAPQKVSGELDPAMGGYDRGVGQRSADRVTGGCAVTVSSVRSTGA